MSVVTLTGGTDQEATAGDAGKMFILTGSESLDFAAENLTGRRFEFFNMSGTSQNVDFLAGTTVNGVSGATLIALPNRTHAVVMGIGNGEYIAWFSKDSSPA
jgi:hypothetical protein